MSTNRKAVEKKPHKLFVLCEYCNQRVRADKLTWHISINHQGQLTKDHIANKQRKQFQNEGQATLQLKVVTSLTHEDGGRYFRGFEQYVGETVNLFEFVGWLETLKRHNTPLTYRNIADLRKVQSRVAIDDRASKISQPGAVQDCICKKDDRQILEWIQNQTIPEEALCNDCCWIRICQVRGRNLPQVEEDTWEEICRTRGYLKYVYA